MYKDDLEAAILRADEAEQRADELEKKLNMKTKENIIRRFFRRVWAAFCKHKKFIIPQIIIILALFGFVKACMYKDNKQNIFISCVRSYCVKQCKSYDTLVTTSFEFIGKGDVITCSCYLKDGIKLFNFKTPKQCKE